MSWWQEDSRSLHISGWHHWLDGRESEWTPGVGDGQGGLVCCDSWGRKKSDTTERLNWTDASVMLVKDMEPHLQIFLLRFSTACAVLCLVAQSRLAFCNPMYCSSLGSSVYRDSPGTNNGVDCHALLQGIFPTQGSNPGLLYCRWILTNWATREAQKDIGICIFNTWTRWFLL